MNIAQWTVIGLILFSFFRLSSRNSVKRNVLNSKSRKRRARKHEKNCSVAGGTKTRLKENEPNL